MVGLDAAGKTTTLYRMKCENLLRTIPTIGFNVENFKYKKVDMNIWDVGGRCRQKFVFDKYYQEADTIVIVIDSTDIDRFNDIKKYLKDVEDLLSSNCIVLFLANKQDLSNSKSSSEIAKELKLFEIKQNWFIQPCSAITGEGLLEGFDWISNELKKK